MVSMNFKYANAVWGKCKILFPDFLSILRAIQLFTSMQCFLSDLFVCITSCITQNHQFFTLFIANTIT